MADPRDIVDIDSLRTPRRKTPPTDETQPGRKFLAIWFRCCHVYGRIYRNAAQSAYDGRCPRCGGAVSATIGPGGTKQRMFQAR